MSEDPLDAVFDTPEELEGVNREKLANMIKPFAIIDPENGTFHAKSSWNKLTAKRKVLVFLLARLALSIRNPEFSKIVSPKEIEEGTELPGGTVRPKLKELVTDRIAYRDSGGVYYIRSTSMSINNAWAVMEEELGE